MLCRSSRARCIDIPNHYENTILAQLICGGALVCRELIVYTNSLLQLLLRECIGIMYNV